MNFRDKVTIKRGRIYIKSPWTDGEHLRHDKYLLHVQDLLKEWESTQNPFIMNSIIKELKTSIPLINMVANDPHVIKLVCAIEYTLSELISIYDLCLQRMEEVHGKRVDDSINVITSMSRD